MRVSISNIAWDVIEDNSIAELLRRYHVDAIDIAPGKYFPNPEKVTTEDIIAVRNWWHERGIEIVGMQALLFGTSGLNVFGSDDVKTKMLNYLTNICRIAAGLGVKFLVFGSPKNRDCTGLSQKETLDVAVSFFQRLGDIASQYGVVICLEPNPPCYGANFMTTSAETADIVNKVDHNSIKMQLDTGSITINQESALAVIKEYSAIIGHVHISEPDLLPLGEGGSEHLVLSKVIKTLLPKHIATIEMKATVSEPHLVAIERSLLLSKMHYMNIEKRNS